MYRSSARRPRARGRNRHPAPSCIRAWAVALYLLVLLVNGSVAVVVPCARELLASGQLRPARARGRLDRRGAAGFRSSPPAFRGRGGRAPGRTSDLRAAGRSKIGGRGRVLDEDEVSGSSAWRDCALTSSSLTSASGSSSSSNSASGSSSSTSASGSSLSSNSASGSSSLTSGSGSSSSSSASGSSSSSSASGSSSSSTSASGSSSSSTSASRSSSSWNSASASGSSYSSYSYSSSSKSSSSARSDSVLP